jgi:transposase
VLRLSQLGGLSRRAIARSLKISPTSAGECLRRAEAAGLSWEQAQALGDAALERRLYPGEGRRAQARPQPEWTTVHRELRRKGVTLALLWEEYKRSRSGRRCTASCGARA